MAEYNDPSDALNHLISSHLADSVNTALECVIIKYSNGRVDVKPIGSKVYTDGDSNSYGVLYDLPLHWPQGAGGTAGVKVPIKEGDKCLAIFAQHPQGEGESTNTRRFSLADGYVIPGCSYDDAHAGNESVSLYYGEASIQITEAGKVLINAPAGFEVTSPDSTFSEKLTANGLVTFNGGAVGNSKGGVNSMTINGKLVVTDGSSTIGGKVFLDHIHSNGNNGNNTGKVV